MNFFEKLATAFTNSNAGVFIIQFLILAALFYFMMYVLKSNNADLLNYLFVAFVVITGIIFVFVEDVNNFIYILFPIFYVLAMISMFTT